MMPDLFEVASAKRRKAEAPLADRLRPTSLEEFVGQKHLLSDGKALSVLIQKDRLPSLIFWGPPGSGKTTLARIIAGLTQANFIALSAVFAGVKDLRAAVDQAKEDFKFAQKKTILFIDEIHRFNKAQQDALLPHVEEGTITLIGATTENPSFEVIGPLLSRCRVFVLEPLHEADLSIILERGRKATALTLDKKAETFLVEYAGGDARRLLNVIEVAASLVGKDRRLTLPIAEQASQHKTLLYDKDREEHYNLISAFIKSMRASDPDAAIYYLARMYEAGEEPRFLARRMVIFAAEDISNKDPQALQVAVAAAQAYEIVGEAEGWIPLAQAAIYLAKAPKSNASYMAYKRAKEEIAHSGSLPTPLHLRNAPTELMKHLGYGKDYRYPHSDPAGAKEMTYLPEKIKGFTFYHPKKRPD